MSSFVHAHCGLLFFLAAVTLWIVTLWPVLSRAARFFFSRNRRRGCRMKCERAPRFSLCLDEDGTVLGAVGRLDEPGLPLTDGEILERLEGRPL